MACFETANFCTGWTHYYDGTNKLLTGDPTTTADIDYDSVEDFNALVSAGIFSWDTKSSYSTNGFGSPWIPTYDASANFDGVITLLQFKDNSSEIGENTEDTA